MQEQNRFCAEMCAYYKAEQHAERSAVLEALFRAGYAGCHCDISSYNQGTSNRCMSLDIIP